ncbi:MAG TPA: FAD-dependent oxidoreductase [Solirubrobacteraceae bacterium]|nr:FAD-dependent oxidoreductase [Solirubrobacteraceae bacterium]
MGEREVVIIGAGLGAVRVAQQLRQRGHRGPITVLGAEPHLPYDRPPLSKQVLRGEADTTTYPDTDRLDVRWVLGTRAVSLDAARSKVLSEDGRAYGYDALVLAPGGRARTLPGLDVGSGVHVLRTIDDALALRAAIRASKRLIVIGAGFIGCEIAASARQIGSDVDLIEVLPAPLIRVLGPAAASRVTDLHAAHGVRLHVGATVAAGVLRGSEGDVRGVRLGDGTVLDGGDVVVGIGISPNVDWLTASGVELQDGIVCDCSGRTSVPNIFALGDAAQWWHELAAEHRRVEHWTTTADQAAVVAATITQDETGAPAELRDAPYFWSDQYEIKIQGIGFIDPSDHVDELSIRDRPVLLYSRNGIVRGVVGFSIPAAVMRTKPLIERGAPVSDAIDLLTA